MKRKEKLDIAKLIDHTLLRPDATVTDILKLCEEAEKYAFSAVCVNPFFVRNAKKLLLKSEIKVSTVIGFPLGVTFPEVKIYEAMQAVLSGADELDVVMNMGAAKSGNWKAVEKEISDVVTATPDTIHKIIIETCYLTDNEKRSAARAVMNAGAEFIKTSTGFGPTGAAVKDLEIIRSITEGRIGIKAAGGIKTLNDVLAFVDAGATRIGTSSGAEIMKEMERGNF
jgi:deoxyribose-phosphate aldolase